MKERTPIKVCHICSYYENILFDNLVCAQRGATDPRVFFFKKHGRDIQYNKDYIDEVNCFNEIDRFFFFIKEKKACDAFLKTYPDYSFDINYAHSLFVNGYLAYKAKKQFGTPYIVMVQNTDLNVFYKYRPYLKKTGLTIMANASRVIFASESYKKTLIEKYIPLKYRDVISKKSVVIPYGIEDLFFEDQEESSKTIKGQVRLITVGLICKNKNHVALCEAVSKLRSKGIDINVTIIGKVANDTILNRLKEFDFVNILPFMPKEELKKMYRQNHIFALTSITETFGLVYAEALSQQLPILYSKGQGFDGQFPEGFVGYSVDAKDINDTANGIEKIINNYETLAVRTAEASKKFRWAAVSQQYIDVYSEITGVKQ